MEGTATKILGRATLTKYQALVLALLLGKSHQGLPVDWLEPFFFFFLFLKNTRALC